MKPTHRATPARLLLASVVLLAAAPLIVALGTVRAEHGSQVAAAGPHGVHAIPAPERAEAMRGVHEPPSRLMRSTTLLGLVATALVLCFWGWSCRDRPAASPVAPRVAELGSNLSRAPPGSSYS